MQTSVATHFIVYTEYLHALSTDSYKKFYELGVHISAFFKSLSLCLTLFQEGLKGFASKIVDKICF